jgi:hypothetical protein
MKYIFEQYQWEVLHIEQLHQGLINKTFIIKTTEGDFILQTINHHIFKQPEQIDDNIKTIGNYLTTNFPTYLYTHLIQAKNKKTLLEWEGCYYRAFQKIDGYALSKVNTTHQAYQAAAQFGKFTKILSGLNMNQLHVTLPNFHNLNLRYESFLNAIVHGNQNRIQTAKNAISFLQAHKWIVEKYQKFINHPAAKLRVTHHDTKISNVLFSDKDGMETAICVIDLDTVMPGYIISDIGDMCRTYLCNVTEEEENLALISVEPSKWEAIKNGYIREMEASLSSFEIGHLFFGGQFMIYMQALRFMTDHLSNDMYYGAKKEGHNYLRALNQIRLLEVFSELESY